MEKDETGNTAADYAVRNGLKDVVSLLCASYEQIKGFIRSLNNCMI